MHDRSVVTTGCPIREQYMYKPHTSACAHIIGQTSDSPLRPLRMYSSCLAVCHCPLRENGKSIIHTAVGDCQLIITLNSASLKIEPPRQCFGTKSALCGHGLPGLGLTWLDLVAHPQVGNKKRKGRRAADGVHGRGQALSKWCIQIKVSLKAEDPSFITASGANV